ncbi:hypothetical protein [Microcoleus sp. S13_C5]
MATDVTDVRKKEEGRRKTEQSQWLFQQFQLSSSAWRLLYFHRR